jgi:uncharacterized protein (DUF1501 family)
MAFSRRRFLQLSTLASASFFVPEFLSASTSDAFVSRKRLVVVQLTGGNDGLNTVVPFQNDIYYQSRPTIAIERNKVLTLTDEIGLHPSLKNIYSFYQQGAVSVIQNVGYPRPHRSHQKCLEVWRSADTDGCSSGWLGRYADHRNSARLFSADAECCLALTGERSAYTAPLSDPDTSLADKFRVIASMIHSQPSPDIFYLSHQGYDTHVAQNETQTHLLKELDEAIAGFVDNLKRNDHFKNVLILTISEFGRRVAENDFGGTDHGTANCMFAISGGLKHAGLSGYRPVLSDLDDGDLKHSTDFRQAYSTVLERWLSADPRAVLNQKFTALDFV